MPDTFALSLADLLDPPSTFADTYRHDPLGFARDCVDWTGSDGLTGYQAEILAAIPTRRRVSPRGPHGLGKDLSLDTPLPTPTGWTTMGMVAPGDLLLDEQGLPCRVLYAEPPAWREAFSVRFADGARITAGAGHLWTAVDVYHRPKKRVHGVRRPVPVSDWRDHWDAGRTVETRQIAETLRTAGGQLRWRVPTCRPLDLPAAPLPVDPYVLGYWLGDGATASGRISVCAQDRASLEAELHRAGYLTRAREDRTCWTVTASSHRRAGTLQAQLRSLGVLGHKHIPMLYLRASAAQRMELVRGLWDSDGYRQAGGCDEIALTRKQLAADVAELLRSLGLATRVRERRARLSGVDCGPCWRIAARFEERPYRLGRYDWSPRERQASRHTQRTVTAVEPVGTVPTRCIAVDSPSKLFLAGEDFIPTHNTAIAALVLHWFALTRDQAGIDWKAITTAGAWGQLERYLWPEVHKWAARVRWDVVGRGPYTPNELLKLSLQLRHGAASAAASSNPALIEGAHADSILYVFDEAKSIPVEAFDAAEGAFSAARPDGLPEAFALAASTPGEPAGRFHAIHVRRPGLEDWWPRHVTLAEAVAAGRIAPEWAEQRGRLWGVTSAIYANRVLGEFAASDEDATIPLAWVEAAVERWRDWQAAGGLEPSFPLVLGVDVADTGSDSTVIAARKGNVITGLQVLAHADPMETAGHVKARMSHPSDLAVVDGIGVGAGVVARLREEGVRVASFIASAKSPALDRGGQLGMLNARAAGWWHLRELLDPALHADLCLPDDDLLVGELVAPHWRLSSSGRIQIEAKEQVKARLGRSTDRADAVIHACAPVSAAAPTHAYYAGYEPDGHPTSYVDRLAADDDAPWWEVAAGGV